MFKVNEYFNGKVKSMAFKNSEGAVTAGIMAPGEYEFGTSSIEYMTVVSGQLVVQLPGETEWKTVKEGDAFEVPANSVFKLKVPALADYCCSYIS